MADNFKVHTPAEFQQAILNARAGDSITVMAPGEYHYPAAQSAAFAANRAAYEILADNPTGEAVVERYLTALDARRWHLRTHGSFMCDSRDQALDEAEAALRLIARSTWETPR